MRNRAMALILAPLLAAPSGMGQTSVSDRIVATIPFAFTTGQTTLPAGEWTLVRLITESGPSRWTLMNSTGEYRLLLVGQPVYRQLTKRTTLEFNCYEGHCFLSRIWMTGELGAYFPPGRTERNLLTAGVKPRQNVLFARMQ